jgi:hypothetical protein
MRKVLLTALLIGLLTVPLFAQRRGGGRGGFGFGGMLTGDMLLSNKSVQTELKFDDDQKKAVAEIAKKQQEAIAKAREDMDFSGIGKIMEESRTAYGKLRKTLKSAQETRLTQIEIQLADRNKSAEVFKRENVAKALKLTDKQKSMIKDTLTSVESDTKELREEAKGDREKFREIQQKIQKLRTEAYTKITKGFSEDQQKAWKEMQGEKFELKMDNPFGGRGGKGGKKKDKSDF